MKTTILYTLPEDTSIHETGTKIIIFEGISSCHYYFEDKDGNKYFVLNPASYLQTLKEANNMVDVIKTIYNLKNSAKDEKSIEENKR